MALKVIATIQNFQKDSSDTFPDTAVKEGSTCHNVDTGETYVYYDGTWEQDLRLVYAINAV
jgi:hypothetical protein